MSPNKGVQGTLHKVSGPLTPDVGLRKTEMKILPLLFGFILLGLLLSGCHHTSPNLLFEWSRPALSGGDGSTPDQAIVLNGISTLYIGGRVQDEWINKHYPESAIRDVRESILNNRIIKEIIIETSPARTNNVFFDITAVQMKPGLGMWYFVSDDGYWSCADMITEEWFDQGSEMFWQPIVGERNGKIICQVDDQVGDGLVQVGELKRGKKHGIWKSMRPLEGLMTEEYIEGQRQ